MSDQHSIIFLVVDDHALFRAGLAMLLAQAWPDARRLEAASLHEGLSLAATAQPDLILLDVRLPDAHALADLPMWRARAPQAALLLMSSEVDGTLLQAVRASDAIGFLHKAAGPEAVLATVGDALAHRPAFGTVPYDALQAPSPELPAVQVQDAAAPFQPTSLQTRIIQFLGRGTPNKAIARQVGLSETQVRVEVSWLTEALGADSREDAYRRAQALGWVSP